MPSAQWEGKLSLLPKRTAHAFRAASFLFRPVWNPESRVQRLCRKVPHERRSALIGVKSRLHLLTLPLAYDCGTTVRLIFGVALIAGGAICLFLANYQHWELQFEVNDRLPADQRFEPVFWTPMTSLKFRKIQKRVLPNSPRPRRGWCFAFAGFCLFLSGVAILATLR